MVVPVYTDPTAVEERMYCPSVYKLDPAALPVFIPTPSTVTGNPATEADIINGAQNTLRHEIVKFERLEN